MWKEDLVWREFDHSYICCVMIHCGYPLPSQRLGTMMFFLGSVQSKYTMVPALENRVFTVCEPEGGESWNWGISQCEFSCRRSVVDRVPSGWCVISVSKNANFSISYVNLIEDSIEFRWWQWKDSTWSWSGDVQVPSTYLFQNRGLDACSSLCRHNHAYHPAMSVASDSPTGFTRSPANINWPSYPHPLA